MSVISPSARKWTRVGVSLYRLVQGAGRLAVEGFQSFRTVVEGQTLGLYSFVDPHIWVILMY